MYLDYYRLKENPFNVTADPNFFFSSKSHTEAISSLWYGIQQRKGIMAITGEVGTGKTTICRKLLKDADKKNKFALVLNPSYSDLELLQIIVHDLGIKITKKNKLFLMEVLNEFLIKQSNKGNNVIVIIDEAQNLSINQLEQIRLLSNLETEKNKLLQIILVGQPELDEKLKLQSLRQLRQRIGIYIHITPLAKYDIKNYIYHRLTMVKSPIVTKRNIIFTEEAINCLHHFSKGSPRTLNILCDRALLAGFVEETFFIDKNIIESCAKEVLSCEYNL